MESMRRGLKHFKSVASITIYDEESLEIRIIDGRESKVSPTVALYLSTPGVVGGATITIHSEGGSAGLLDLIERMRRVVTEWQDGEESEMALAEVGGEA